jgi:hypothetical protein
MFLAWILRDFAKPVMEKLPWIVYRGGSPSDSWYGQQAVYRVSLGNFLFFGLLALTMLGVKFKGDKRDQYLQHGGWFVKIGLWLICNIVPFFFPASLINSYGWVARVGSGCFLCVQILMLLDFVVAWNDSWVDKEDERYLWGLLTITVGAYLGTVGLSGILFYYFKPSGAGDCSFNVTVICFTLFVGVLVSAASMSPFARDGSLFPAAVITLYSAYLCYSALISEPHDYVCNGLGHRLNAASASTLAMGMALTLLSVVYSALRAGSNTQLFSFGVDNSSDVGDEAMESLIEAGEGGLTSSGLDGETNSSRPASASKEKEESAMEEFQPVTYNYSFFHLIFALASCYIAMLMTGWGTGAEERDLIDVGWVSVWVKLCTQWLTAATYIWILVAPTLLAERDF